MDEFFESIAFLDDGTVLAKGTQRSTGEVELLRSVDHGLTWARLSLLNGELQFLNRMSFANPLVGVAVIATGNSGLLARTADGGLTWTVVQNRAHRLLQ